VIGIVLVSHSARLAEGVKELADQMTQGSVPIIAAGGGPDGALGTDSTRIQTALEAVAGCEGILVLMDLGSAVMSAELAVESLAPEQAARVLLSNAPLVEGAIVAAVEASVGHSLEQVNAAAEQAAGMQKVER
jgi:PTS hybrid protein